MSENKYRDYLNNDTFHRSYLKNEDEPVGASFFSKLVVGGAAAVGLAAASAAAYRKGHLKEPIQALIDSVGKIRETRLGAALDGVRNWTESDFWEATEKLGFMDRMSSRISYTSQLNDYVKRSLDSHHQRMEALTGKSTIDETPGLLKLIQQYNATRKARAEVVNKADVGQAEKAAMETKLRAELNLMERAIDRSFNTTKDQQEAMLARTGYRQTTVSEMMKRNELTELQKQLILDAEEMVKDGRLKVNIMDKVIDSDIFTRETGEITDLRGFQNLLMNTMNSAAEDFTMPFVRINPIRMFYLNEFTRRDNKPMFTVLRANTRQPWLAGNNEYLGKDMMYVDGTVYDLDSFDSSTNTFKVAAEGIYLLDATGKNSPLTRLSRNMAGVTTSTFDDTPPDGFISRAWWNLSNKLDLFKQDEPIKENLEVADPATIVAPIAERLHHWMTPYKGKFQRGVLETAFGDNPDWLAMRGYKNIGQFDSAFDYFKQFTASRYNSEHVTTASFFFYGFAERLNATLNQVGLGLSNANLGSAPQILGNLIARRVAPVMLSVEAVRATNHAFEMFFGDEYEDYVAEFFKGTDIQLAEIRENLGMDSFFETASELMPGHEFISELPIPILTTEGMTPIQIKDLPLIGNLDKSADELRDWYETGEEAVRKGRYWEFGNTPYTGGKVDYYQPNWYRRITSDWEYQENTYQSKGEYWMFHPRMPILDPYHWEKEHYQDRPYMATGGMPIIEDFPLIGPLLNRTIGQIIKPTVGMHTEEQRMGDNYLANLEGFQLAGEYGLIGGSGGGLGGAGTSGGGLGLGVGGGSGDPIAYTTASGATRIMTAAPGVNIGDLNRSIKEAGIAKTGVAQDVRFSGGMPIAQEMVGNPETHATMANMMYNITEMGGYYGWNLGMLTGIKAYEYDPRIETSRRAYGYQRAFWDQDLGNLGADANEIFRRFLPRDAHKNYVNTIDNNMPTWLPGPEYFTDFQHGDPYVKVKKGEMRLPGQAYEVLYGIDSEKIDSLEIGASLIGYDKQKMVESWLHRDDVQDEMAEFVTNRGTKWHKSWERDMKNRGVALSMEQYVKNEELAIGGFYDVHADHTRAMEWLLENAVEFNFYQRTDDRSGAREYDGFYADPVNLLDLNPTQRAQAIQNLLQASPTVLLDPKTKSDETFAKQKMQFANTQQVNFYASQMGTRINYLIHADPDNPEKGIKVQAFEYSPELMNYTAANVESARSDVRKMLADGAVGRGDLYDAIDRYRILADVAPYSNNYRQMKAQLSKIDLSDEERREVQEINDQVSSRKDKVRTYDYRFKYSDVTNINVTVTKVLDNNMFLTKEHPDNPIRLAGVYVPTGKDDARAEAARSLISEYVRPGARIQIQVAADEARRINGDTYGTISANIGSLNRRLINEGLANEKKEDYSAPAVHARFTSGQIAFGKMWENFAHADTPLHTKLLQVRSPLEQYERREVYGKDWQDWSSPVQDFMIPWYQNIISHSPAWAAGLGGFMGAMFGAHRYGMIIGGIFGAVTGGLGASIVKGFEMASGDAWVPDRRQREREIEEYVDILKYVKYSALYRETADLAQKREGFDVEAYIEKNERAGDWREDRIRALQAAKEKLKEAASPEMEKLARKEAIKVLGPGIYPDVTKALNKEINQLRNARRADRITPLAAQAVMYHDAAKKTMYGYEAGDPLQNILSALPRKEREYLTKFIDAPKEEREQILKVVPDYVKRVLQSVWGLPVDDKPDLEKYFTQRELPDANWVGWDPRANLDDIKIKMVQKSGLDEGEFNIWPDDIKRANQIRDDVTPQLDLSTKINTVRRKLRDILGGAGIEDLEVEVYGTPTPGIQVDADIRKDRRAEVLREMNENGYALI